MQVPNSSGTARPKLQAPDNSCDCHMHIYDGGRFPPPRPESRMQPNAGVAGLPAVAAAHRDEPRHRGDAGRLSHRQRGDARRHRAAWRRRRAASRWCIRPSPTPSSSAWHDGGIRGIRFTQFDPKTATTTMDMIEPLARRVQPLGWHVQIHLRADQIVAAADLLLRLPGTIVFDHLGRLTPPEGPNHPAFARHPPDARRRPHLDEAVRRVLVRRPAGLCGRRARWRGPISRPRPSAWCGAATGRIRPRTTSPTTRCCSTC